MKHTGVQQNHDIVSSIQEAWHLLYPHMLDKQFPEKEKENTSEH